MAEEVRSRNYGMLYQSDDSKCRKQGSLPDRPWHNNASWHQRIILQTASPRHHVKWWRSRTELNMWVTLLLVSAAWNVQTSEHFPIRCCNHEVARKAMCETICDIWNFYNHRERPKLSEYLLLSSTRDKSLSRRTNREIKEALFHFLISVSRKV